VVAVVQEKYDFPADLFLQAPRRGDLGEQKPLRKKSARLLAEANDRVIHR
jgi:hypothetical protein